MQMTAYETALSLAPDDPLLHFNKANLLFGLARFEESQAELLTVTRLRPGDILGAAVPLAAITWPADTTQARQHLQAALAAPGERLTPFTRAFYRAIALTGLGRAGPKRRSASWKPRRPPGPGRRPRSTTDTALLNRFRDPPLPGLELLLQFFEPVPASAQPQEQTGEQKEPAGRPSPA